MESGDDELEHQANVHNAALLRGHHDRSPQQYRQSSPCIHARYPHLPFQLKPPIRQAASARFTELADHYPIEDDPYGGPRVAYPLAYFAYAAAHSGDPVGLEAYIGTLKTRYSFDYWLAKAFFAASHQKVDEAADALQSAFLNLPRTLDGPLVADYQFAEACEWLYRDTHDERFLKTLLDWTRRSEQVHPEYAWPYAIRYPYENDRAERQRLLAMTLYLDPASAHIRTATHDQRRAASDGLRELRIPAKMTGASA